MSKTMNTQSMEMPAESRLDEGVERIRQIDRERDELQRERNAVSDEVEKLCEVMLRKVEEASNMVRGDYPKTAEASPPPNPSEAEGDDGGSGRVGVRRHLFGGGS